MANDWNVPVITPVGNTENIGDKLLFPRLTRLNPLMQSSVVDTVFSIMRSNGWKHTVFFYDNDDTMGDLYGETFTRTSEFVWSSYELAGKTDTRETYRTHLMDATLRARVFLLAIQNITLRDFMLEAHAQGYTTSGDYVFIIMFTINIPATDSNTWLLGNGTAEQKILKAAFGQALFLYIDSSNVVLPANFSQEMRRRSLQYFNYDYQTEEPSTVLAQYYDAVKMYATVVNESLTAGENPFDGLAITRRLWNRTFDDICPLQIAHRNMPTNIPQKYALYDSAKKKITFSNSSTFPWPYNGGKAPGNEPTCGFAGDRCQSSAKATHKPLLLQTSLRGSRVDSESQGPKDGLLAVFRGQMVRLRSLPAYPLKQTDNLLLEFKMVRELSHNNLLRIFGACLEENLHALVVEHCSKGSLQVSQVVEHCSKGSLQVVEHCSKGSLQVVEHCSKGSLQVSQVVEHCSKGSLQVSQVVEHCSKGSLQVVEHCSKGSLQVVEHYSKGSQQDLLGNTNVTLDAQFKFSLCTDIINGLCYLHESPIRCHGRLNSEVCLVDNRFSVKLSDFGLPSLYSRLGEDVNSQEYKNLCLWKAPETLRSGDKRGSREADIYSFAIMLAEVITRDFPYSNEILYLSIDEILQKIVLQTSTPFRPIIEVPVKMSEMKILMERCWAESPKDRPHAQTVKAAIKKIALSLGETGNLLDNLMRRMELYANNLEKLVEDKTVELREEKKKSEELLYQILPRSVADRLKAGMRMEPESYDCVTIYFSDIVGFTAISAKSTPIQVVDLLNDLYSCFDAIVEEFDVYKVETIGDAYMVVSGLPQRNGNLHAVHIARMSLKLLKAISQFKIRHMPTERMRLRIGLHSGPVCAGVVGLKMPRYCLFGDTVNTASRMESHGEAMMIHMSSSIKAILDLFGTFEMTPRGEINIKGKGMMTTYWLTREPKNEIHPLPSVI
ncbi:atrial natriuretic peptide receptor 1-like [Physella acuta]|uniref:atrial natriuretic peptide receptor 1-like n=1 Tax=Physella acuta TaxID=109671 RepID=UPI0027DB2021|nr:atrial natriuretic peptide receptor 1-like [Physella acuta]